MRALLVLLALLVPSAARADPITSTIAAVKAFFTISITVSSTWAAVATAAAAVWNAAIVNFALGKISQTLFGSRASGPAASSQQYTVRATLAAREIVYGEVRKSGVMLWEGTSGGGRRYLWRVLVIAGHQIESMTDVWLGPDLIPSSAIDGSGNVTSGAYAGKVSIWRLLGTDGQTTEPNLEAAFPEIDTTFRARGRALLILRFDRDDKVFETGAPQNVFVLVRGKRVYDPRLDSTNGGSGPHRLLDATTWTWSDNPALCTSDYATGGSTVYDVATPKNRLGVRLSGARIDWPLVIASANKCDELVAVPGGTQKRYRCSGVLVTTSTHEQNLDSLLEAMHGNRVFHSGRLRIYAGAFDAPSETITDDDLSAAGYKVQGAVSQNDLFNQVAAAYIDRARGWIEATSFVRTSASFEAADGQPILRNIQMPMVTDEYQAQRIAEIVKQQSRNQITVELNLKISALRVAPWDTFYLNLSELGWTNKVFRAYAIRVNMAERRVLISAREESSSAYADLLAGEYSAAGSASASRESEAPFEPSSLTTVNLADAVLMRWVRSPDPGVMYELRESSSGSMTSPVSLPDAPDTQATITRTSTAVAYFQVRARKGGQVSAWVPDGFGVAGAALVISSGFRVDAAAVTLFTSSSSTTGGNPNATPINGTPAYTYAWTYVSGDTSIACTSPTSPTTTFSRSGMTAPGSWTAVWRVTVTDSTAATAQKDITVTFVRT